KSLTEIDTVVGDLVDAARASGRSVIILSEYGITPVNRPIHINSALRDAGLLSVREEDGGELLDPISSKAFAVADHQIAHIYLSDVGLQAKVKELLKGLDGVERVYDATDKCLIHLDHRRSGELVEIADSLLRCTHSYSHEHDRTPHVRRY